MDFRFIFRGSTDKIKRGALKRESLPAGQQENRDLCDRNPDQRRQHNERRQRLGETENAAALPLAMAAGIAAFAVNK